MNKMKTKKQETINIFYEGLTFLQKLISNYNFKSKLKESYEFVKSISIALIVAIIIRSVMFEPFSVPSGSMKPNFLVGDYLFVSKYYYGISKHSFPLSLDLFEGRKFVLNKPQRGDVIVFRSPQEPASTHYIKRLVGLEGDRIQVKEGKLYINGKSVKLGYNGAFTDTDGKKINENIETLPSGVSYKILDENPFGYLDNTPVYIVPKGHYFFMGDNRDSSIDSRVTGGPIGFVPEEYIVGKATLILFSNPEPLWKLWKWVISFNLNRFFIKITP